MHVSINISTWPDVKMIPFECLMINDNTALLEQQEVMKTNCVFLAMTMNCSY